MLSFDMKTSFRFSCVHIAYIISKKQITKIAILIMTLFKYDVVLDALRIRTRGAPWVITSRR